MPGPRYLPRRAEIWEMEAQGEYELLLILSADLYNASEANSDVIGLYVSHRRKVHQYEVEVRPEETDLTRIAFIQCDQIAVIDKAALQETRAGKVSADTMRKVEDKLRAILDLPRFKRGII